MTPWDKMWILHQDRPEVLSRVRAACSVMVRNEHGDEEINPRIYLDALLTVLEFCGDFHCQATVLTMLLSNTSVRNMKDWLAQVWFKDMPKTFERFLDLHVSGTLSAYCDFLNTYNSEKEFQFVLSVRCGTLRWNDKHLLHAPNANPWLHLNCGTKTFTVTGLEDIPSEVEELPGSFILRSSEIKQVSFYSVSYPVLWTQQVIHISTTKGKLSVLPVPHIDDVSMFVYYVKFISKVEVELLNAAQLESNPTDCNGNLAFEPSRNDFGIYNQDALMVVNPQHATQNSVFQQVSSSQDDAMKTLPNNQQEAALPIFSNSDNNDIEVCDHFRRDLQDSTNESCNDSEDEPHDEVSKNGCEQASNAEVDRMIYINQGPIVGTHSKSCVNEVSDMNGISEMSGTDNCKSVLQDVSCALGSQHHDVPDESTPITPENHMVEFESSQNPDSGKDTDEDTAALQLIAAKDRELQDTERARSVNPSKPKRGRKKLSNLPRRCQLKAPRTGKLPRTLKHRIEAHEECEKSDDNNMAGGGTPRRATRAFTQFLKEALPNDPEFKTPNDVPKISKNQGRRRSSTGQKRKSDCTTLITQSGSSPTNAIVSSQPAAEEASYMETSPSKSMRLSSGDDSGIVATGEETLESAMLPKHPPMSMPTLCTPIATPVRDPIDSFMPPDFSSIHENLNVALKFDALKEEISYGPPAPLASMPRAIPLDPISFQRPSVGRDLNLGFSVKSRKYDAEEDPEVKSDTGDVWEPNVMDSSSDTSYMENTGSAVLLPPIDNGGFPSTCKASPHDGGLDNLQQLSEICSNIVS